MLVTAFDLSTTCTGATQALLDGPKIIRLGTTPILPKEFSPVELGYLATRRKVTPKRGRPFDAYVHAAGEVISRTEKERRDTEVRMASEKARLTSMAEGIGTLLRASHPDLVLLEANMAFRNMSVTKQLGEMAGILSGIAIYCGVTVEKINVHSARSNLNLMAEMGNFAKDKDPAWLRKIDLTKETIKFRMLTKYKEYGLDKGMTTDESDSLLIFDAWYEGRYRDGRVTR